MSDQISIGERSMPQPLAARLRPETIDDIVGQEHLLGEGRVLRRIIEQDMVSSMIFWGPPGVGKTTLALSLAHSINCSFGRVSFSPDTLPSDITGLTIYNSAT